MSNIRLTGLNILIESFTLADLTDTYVDWLNDREVTRFSNQRFREHSRNSSLDYLRSFDGGPNLFLSVKTLADKRPIGTMTAYISVPHGTADIGIMIGERSSWGRGYGLEAWNILLQWLLEQPTLRKATAGTLACNKGMLRIMERSGMSPDGVRRAQEIVEGEPQDILYYARFSDGVR